MIARRALGHTVSHFGDFAPTWAVALFAFAAFVLFKISDAQSAGTVEILGKWTPLFLKGFCNDILITLISMMIGTFLALLLAITRMAGNQFVRGTITAVTGILRNPALYSCSSWHSRSRTSSGSGPGSWLFLRMPR